jgi:hypothetical protein
MPTVHLIVVRTKTPAQNKGRIIGQKRELQSKRACAISVRLKSTDSLRDLILINLAIKYACVCPVVQNQGTHPLNFGKDQQ